ncbi:type III pantothenate kinase [Marinomonas sp. TW1]|uniref:type III pantothenate kinase n=1 Tax=Marinomonas sp. TW1 TaxID=1561203 RepID=UPI000B333A1C|nr:type III pantothenate kinase [Marinomonas sp. TW1]
MLDESNLLVVDAGNTCIKFTAFTGDQVLWVERGESAPLDKAFAPQQIYFASVRSKEQSALLHADIQAAYPNAQWLTITSVSHVCGVSNAYHEPERLGVDRWLAVVGAFYLGLGDVMVLDAGTAIKVDFINGKGVHLGGYITPGLTMMESALLANTARIRYEADEVTVAQGLPDSTARAVTEGVHEMALAFVERMNRQHPSFKWVATGGDSRALLDSLQIEMEYQPNLVALGAKRVGDELIKRQ